MLKHQYLLSVLSYNPETGVFLWRYNPHRRGGRIRANGIAGTKTRAGYLVIGLGKEHYLAHRLAWFYTTKGWPEQQVDHRNGLRTDNRWANLRLATAKQQRENATPQRRSTSGVRGVYWFARTQRWYATINHNKKNLTLGYHDTLLDAVAVRRAAERQLFTHHREYL